jgi:iron complex transport system substrate-binding protein
VRRLILLLLLGVLATSARAAPPGRIISLAPNLTEIVYAAGAGPLLVGTVAWSDYPAAARDLPQVGDGWRIDLEGVLALRPDLVLAWSPGTPRATIDRLRAMQLQVIEVPTHRLADIPAALRLVGGLAGTATIAEAAAGRFEAEVRQLRGQHARAKPLRVMVQVEDRPLFTVNGKHVISEIVALCGGQNVFAELGQIAPQVDAEAVLARDPEVILGADGGIDALRAQWARWPRLTAVHRGAIYALPADTLARASPRLTQGARAVCAALDDARRRLP